MAKQSKEELTTKMHSDLSVSESTDRKHVVWTALSAIYNELISRSAAMKAYNITEADIQQYEKEWEDLNDQD